MVYAELLHTHACKLHMHLHAHMHMHTYTCTCTYLHTHVHAYAYTHAACDTNVCFIELYTGHRKYLKVTNIITFNDTRDISDTNLMIAAAVTVVTHFSATQCNATYAQHCVLLRIELLHFE